MKRLFAISIPILVLCFFASSSVFAQRTDGPEGSEYKPGEAVLKDVTWEAGIDIGSVFLHSDSHTGYKAGIGFGGHLEYFIDDIFSLAFSLGYSYHSGPTGADGMNNLWFDIGPRSRLLWDPIGFFLSLSPGFNLNKFGAPVNDSAFSFGINFGSGVDLLLSDAISMGLTYKYHLIFDTDTSTIGIGAGDFQSLMLKINFSF